jgi:hypothetical protein
MNSVGLKPANPAIMQTQTYVLENTVWILLLGDNKKFIQVMSILLLSENKKFIQVMWILLLGENKMFIQVMWIFLLGDNKFHPGHVDTSTG